MGLNGSMFRCGVLGLLVFAAGAGVCQQEAPATEGTAAPSASGQSTPQVVPAQPGASTLPPVQQQPGTDVPFTITTRANLVNLVFTVTDKNGRFIRNLQRKDFGLLDDGFPPASVVAFTQQTNLPLRIGIMLDTSSSIRSRFKFEQDAAQDFFSAGVEAEGPAHSWKASTSR